MRRVNVRQRPLQSTKRIRVYHLSVDGSFISDNGDRIPAGAGELEDCVSWWFDVINAFYTSQSTNWLDKSTAVLVIDQILLWKRWSKRRLLILPAHSYSRVLILPYSFVVPRENILSKQGSHLHPQTSHSNHPQLRRRGFSLFQAIEWIYQVHPTHAGGRGQPCRV